MEVSVFPEAKGNISFNEPNSTSLSNQWDRAGKYSERGKQKPESTHATLEMQNT